MKRIAVITGASSGMGCEFVRTIKRLKVTLDEVWVIARRTDKLKAIECPYPVKPISMDLTDRSNFKTYAEMLEEEKPSVQFLVNASGFGKFDATIDTPLDTNLNLVDLNVQALQAMCQITIPYMEKGSHILNIASVAAFQPIPYINVYAASKAFVLSYSRGLNREVKNKGIHVTALCPFWTKTEFFAHADRGNSVVKKYTAMYDTEVIVKRAYRDLLRNKDVSQYGFIARGQALLCKMLPHKWIMNIWLNQQKLKKR